MAVNDGGWRHGGFWRISARSGFKVRGYNTIREWTGNYVAADEYEPRNAQDFVRGLRDKMVVDNPRPRDGVDTFIGPLGTALTVAGAAGDTTITVGSTASMVVGNTLVVALDNGTLITTISVIPSATTVTLNKALPSGASIGNAVTDYSVSTAANIG